MNCLIMQMRFWKSTENKYTPRAMERADVFLNPTVCLLQIYATQSSLKNVSKDAW